MSESRFINVIVREPGIHVVQLRQSVLVNQDQVDQVKAELLALADNSARPLIVLSLGGVTQLSSAMFGALILLNRKAKEKDGVFILAYVPTPVANTIRTISLDKIFTICKDLDQALEKIASAKPAPKAGTSFAARLAARFSRGKSSDDVQPDDT